MQTTTTDMSNWLSNSDLYCIVYHRYNCILDCNEKIFHSHDLRSAWRVRLRSRGVGRGPGPFMAVFTNDSMISSSPSVKFSSFCLITGDRSPSARRRRHVRVPSELSFREFVEPSNCLQVKIQNVDPQELMLKTWKNSPCKSSFLSKRMYLL